MHHPCSSKLLIYFLAPLKAKPPTREHVANLVKPWFKQTQTNVRTTGRRFPDGTGCSAAGPRTCFPFDRPSPSQEPSRSLILLHSCKKISYKYSFNTSVSTKNVQDKYKVNPYLNLRKDVEYNKLISTSLLLKKFRKLNLHTGFSYLW